MNETVAVYGPPATAISGRSIQFSRPHSGSSSNKQNSIISIKKSASSSEVAQQAVGASQETIVWQKSNLLTPSRTGDGLDTDHSHAMDGQDERLNDKNKVSSSRGRHEKA